MNIRSAITEGTDILKGKSVNSAQLDSEILLASAIDQDRKYIILNNDQNIKEKNLRYFQKLINKRSFREPIAYLTNKKHFWKYKFFVTKDVLIPRPDTELIVAQVLKTYSKDKYLQVLDIGTGSGCILLSLLAERPQFCGTGIDISKQSINVSKYNAKRLNLINRVKFYNSDVDNFKNRKYDLIVSNPPYIEISNLKYLERDVINFEPKLALNGGFDGFSKIRKVIDKAAVLIKRNGKLILEIGFNQKNITQRILKKEGFYINKVLKDYGYNDRCIICTKI